MDRASRSKIGELQKTDQPSGLQKAEIPEKKDGEQMKPNCRNVVTKLYVVAVLASALMGAALNAAAAGPPPPAIANVGPGHGALPHAAGRADRRQTLQHAGYTA